MNFLEQASTTELQGQRSAIVQEAEQALNDQKNRIVLEAREYLEQQHRASNQAFLLQQQQFMEHANKAEAENTALASKLQESWQALYDA